jgi:hypothetical protein
VSRLLALKDTGVTFLRPVSVMRGRAARPGMMKLGLGPHGRRCGWLAPILHDRPRPKRSEPASTCSDNGTFWPWRHLLPIPPRCGAARASTSAACCCGASGCWSWYSGRCAMASASCTRVCRTRRHHRERVGRPWYVRGPAVRSVQAVQLASLQGYAGGGDPGRARTPVRGAGCGRG